MKKNLGSTDQIVRVVIAIIIAILYFTHVISGTMAVVLGALAIIFVLTAAIGFCPIYWPFNISTRQKNK